jgi:Tfp pilus assembly protein PilP
MKTWKTSKMNLIITALALLIISGYGCGDKMPERPVSKAPLQSAQSAAASADTQQAQAQEDSAASEGYVYQQRDRRDPFVPLIVPDKERFKGKVERSVGTLQSYDLSEFSLSAIATKGTKYFALLVTPDNRSFTVTKGTVIGLNKGKVNQILKDRVILVEYSKDFRGELKERQLILEFHKGETK